MKDKIFIGCPTHDGRVDYMSARALFQFATKNYEPAIVVSQCSLINLNCNRLWAQALTMRKAHNIKWFALLHSDIVPEYYWLDKLVEIGEKNNAAMVGTVVPIKEDLPPGEIRSSIALSNPLDKNWMMYSILVNDAIEKFPVVFDYEDAALALNLNPQIKRKLLLNTGCMIVRIDQPWSEKLIFKCEERIVNTGSGFIAQSDPEDWNFSRQVSEHGRVLGTTCIKVEHMGVKGWKNY